MAKKKKLKTVRPQGTINVHTWLADNEGCGHIRTIFPSLMLNQFKHKATKFEWTFNSHFVHDINFFKSKSMIKFQRAALPQHLQLIMSAKEVAKHTNLGILYEADDLLTPDMPETNFAHSYYAQNWPIIEQMLSLVDGITVSTEPLRQHALKYNKNVVVCPNHLPEWLWEQQDAVDIVENKKNDKIRILWAGSANHFSLTGEGGDFGKEILKFIKDTTDKYQWVFVGAMPNELKNVEGIEFHTWQKILSFGQFLRKLKCDIGIAPLEKCFFNDCKSNIKVLEYSSLGIPGVYTDCYPYKDTAMASTTETEFINNIVRLAEDNTLRLTTWQHDYELVKDQLYWNDDNLLAYINQHLRIFGKKLG